MSIIGIYASSVRADVNSYESIQSVTVGAGGATSISFSSIPNTYKHLQLRGMVRQTYGSSTYDWMSMSVNGDALGYRHLFWGTGGPNAGAYSDSAPQFIRLWLSATGSVFSVFVVDIYDYANTNKHKTIKAFSGFSADSSNGSVGISSNRYANTSAISSLSFLNNNGNFVQHSTVDLYGIRGD